MSYLVVRCTGGQPWASQGVEVVKSCTMYVCNHHGDEIAAGEDTIDSRCAGHVWASTMHHKEPPPHPCGAHTATEPEVATHQPPLSHRRAPLLARLMAKMRGWYSLIVLKSCTLYGLYV